MRGRSKTLRMCDSDMDYSDDDDLDDPMDYYGKIKEQILSGGTNYLLDVKNTQSTVIPLKFSLDIKYENVVQLNVMLLNHSKELSDVIKIDRN